MKRNPITGDPVLFAPSRAGRPHAFGDPERTGERCPFCPGHEDDTPPAIVTVGEPWRMRVFANLFPPTAGSEVLVESPGHRDAFESLEDPAEVVRLYRSRLEAHRGAACTALFRNEGPRGGASIFHPHSQIVPLGFVPARVEREMAGFRRAACPLCAGIECSVIAEGAHLRWIAPSGSLMPYQQWIVPRRHVARLPELDDAELGELGSMLQSSSRATHRLTDSFNWAFMNFPAPEAHFYVDILPRVTNIAGLELGTGLFVEIIDPASVARRLAG